MQHIYQLVFFPAAWMRGQEIIHAANQSRNETWKNFRKTPDYVTWCIGGALRGAFLDKDKAVTVLTQQQDVYALHEGYYDYALLERYDADMVDAMDGEVEEVETWFKFDFKHSKYMQIPRPECLEGTCKFA